MIAGVIGLGLGSRSAGAAWLPDFVADYAGDTLWALMVFLMLGWGFPRAPTGVLAMAALGVSFAVEFSQMIEAGWLEGLRETRLGALVLGRGFLASDLGCYLAGVLGGGLLELAIHRKRRESGGRVAKGGTSGLSKRTSGG